jgi:1-acyl-sn-glycerol-3-phosphate acyltransferase
MFEQFNLKLSAEEERKKKEAFDKLAKRYESFKDPWGLDLETIHQGFDYLLPLYLKYFNVRVFGKENVKEQPYMLVSNHSGQIPIDGILVTIAMAYDIAPPRLLRSMVERFLAGMPFLGDLTAKTGSILGDRNNCRYLLQNGESILVFPEGVRGVSKNTTDFYNLQQFSSGFLRLALEGQVPILPIAVIGAEEMFPFVYHLKPIAKLFNLPALPLMTNYVPLPSPVDIHIGEPYYLPEGLSPEAPEKEIREHVYQIEKRVKVLINHGLKERRPFFEDIRNPVKHWIEEYKKK